MRVAPDPPTPTIMPFRRFFDQPSWRHVRRVLRHLPLAVAMFLSARESAAFIRASSFKVDGKRYYALFDDGMISMRYAWNLVHGHGLVWNPGERVEGYTNPLWVLVMALAVAVFPAIKAVSAVQVTGAVLSGASAFVFAKLGGRTLRASPWPLVALLEAGLYWMLTTTFPLRFWTHMGMEVSALLAISAGAWWLASARPRRSERALLGVGLLAALAFLVRPDGVLATLPPLLLALSHQRPTARRVLLALAPLLVAVASATLFRWSYYGDWLPNTYRLKMGGFPLPDRLRNGFGFVEPYFGQVAVLGVAALVACVVRPSRRLFALAAGPWLLLAYQIYVGGDPWRYWRQLTPGYPLLLLSSVSLIATVSVLVRRRLRYARVLRFAAPVAALCVVVLGLAPTREAFADGGHVRFNRSWARKNVQRALWLRQALEPGGRIAVIWGGTTPYYAPELFAIDMLGKCDRTVAHQPPDLSGKVAWEGMTSVPGHNKSLLSHSLVDMKADYAEDLKWGDDALAARDKRRFTHYDMGFAGFYLRKKSRLIDWDFVREQAAKRKPEGDAAGTPESEPKAVADAAPEEDRATKKKKKIRSPREAQVRPVDERTP